MILMKCDICGTKTDYEEEQEEYIKIKHVYGYHSNYDGTSVNLDICPECVMKLFKEYM